MGDWPIKALKLIWALLSDLIFGKYQFAEYLRRRSFTTMTLIAMLGATVAFFWMTEQALIHAALARKAVNQLNELTDVKNDRNKEMVRLNNTVRDYEVRLNLVCMNNKSFLCTSEHVPSRDEFCKGDEMKLPSEVKEENQPQTP